MPLLHLVRAFTLAGVSCAALAQPSDAVGQARALVASYIGKSQAFDASLADLYSDHAVIENLRTYPSGEVRRLVIPAARYKALIRAAMPLAQARGDSDSYSQPQYTQQGDKVRVALTRHSHLKNYASPLALVVGPDADGRWRILEERSESRP